MKLALHNSTRSDSVRTGVRFNCQLKRTGPGCPGSAGVGTGAGRRTGPATGGQDTLAERPRRGRRAPAAPGNRGPPEKLMKDAP